jgi:hypothetical protein
MEARVANLSILAVHAERHLKEIYYLTNEQEGSPLYYGGWQAKLVSEVELSECKWKSF